MRRRLFLILAGVTLTQGSFLVVRADPIWPDRRITWSPGITVSVPSKSDTQDVKSHGARGDSTVDDYQAFKAAIDALPSSGGVVKIPAGKYRIGHTLVLDRSIVLRGAGSGASRLYFNITDASPCVQILTYRRGAWTAVTGGMTRGSRQVQVSSTAGFAAGVFAEIQQSNDSAVMYTDPEWKQSWAENSVGQLFVVESASGNTVTLNRPLYIGYEGRLSPQIRTQGFVTFAGAEQLFITRTVATADGPTFHLKNAAYCRIRCVESDHTRTAHVATETAYACEIRDSYFHHSFDYGGGGHGYGVTMGLHTTDCLVENNIFRHLRHAMMVQVGASGNVYGYNYSRENVQGAGETNLNQGWTPCDISMHGHFPNNNLFESNVVQEIDIADYWGPCGPGNTVFRCKVMAEGIDVLDHSNGQNIAANLVPTANYGVNVETGITGTLSHGNVLNGAVRWDAAIADRAFPVSYYLAVKPAFFGDTPWPLFGPEVTVEQVLPAQARFDAGQFIVCGSEAHTGRGQSVGRTPRHAPGGRSTDEFDIRGRIMTDRKKTVSSGVAVCPAEGSAGTAGYLRVLFSRR